MPLPATGDLQLPRATVTPAIPRRDRDCPRHSRAPVLHRVVGNPYFPRVCTLPLPESPPRARGRNPRQRGRFDPPGSLGYPCETLRTSSCLVFVALSGGVVVVAGGRSANFCSPAYLSH